MGTSSGRPGEQYLPAGLIVSSDNPLDFHDKIVVAVISKYLYIG